MSAFRILSLEAAGNMDLTVGTELSMASTDDL